MVLPLIVQPLDAWVDPADAFTALFGERDGDAVWLDSGPGATEGRSFIGTGAAVATASVTDGRTTVAGISREGGILDSLRHDLGVRPHFEAEGRPFGWWGWLGYEAGAAALGLPVHATRAPDASFVFVDRLFAFDHAARRIELAYLDGPEAGSWAESVATVLAGAAGAADEHERAHPVPEAEAHWRHGDAEYLDLIAACQASIRAGDAYQLCLTNRAEARTTADPLAVHLRLRRASPAHHGGFVRIAGETLVSSSPEQFLRVEPDGTVRTKPIKGTRPRGATVAADLELRAELEASEKERAENVMIVDLMRNDLGRVCEVGSVEVRHLLEVESYAQVHQLVSTVEGRLRPGLGALDAVAACFPAGSMTGAPKLSAVSILHDLEGGPRGVYAGCFGYLALDGAVDLAMVIRSIRFADDTATIGAGGGITALSVPEEELDEVRVKAAALFRAAGLTPVANPEAAGNGRAHFDV